MSLELTVEKLKELKRKVDEAGITDVSDSPSPYGMFRFMANPEDLSECVLIIPRLGLKDRISKLLELADSLGLKNHIFQMVARKKNLQAEREVCWWLPSDMEGALEPESLIAFEEWWEMMNRPV